MLDDVIYNVGDCVHLYAASTEPQPYICRIINAFSRPDVQHDMDSYLIEVRIATTLLDYFVRLLC